MALVFVKKILECLTHCNPKSHGPYFLPTRFETCSNHSPVTYSHYKSAERNPNLEVFATNPTLQTNQRLTCPTLSCESMTMFHHTYVILFDYTLPFLHQSQLVWYKYSFPGCGTPFYFFSILVAFKTHLTTTTSFTVIGPK